MQIRKKISLESKKLSKYYLILFFLFFSITLTALFIGFENLDFNEYAWLFTGNDMSAHQIGWYFFKNDIWRFPIGSNPNFGDQIGNSIIFSDSIPLFAIFFKIFSFLLPAKFQYFSLWFIFCFFLQGILSYFLLLKLTTNKSLSFFSSIFLSIYPIFIYRIDWHPALFGQWLIILTVFLTLFQEEKKFSKWIFLLLISSLVHFYFTIISLITFNILKFFSLMKKKIKFKKYFGEIILIHTVLLIFMYFIGYFEVRAVDTVALGFGVYKMNLLSLIDPAITPINFKWSRFLPDLSLSKGEELEGFNYIGLGGLILFTISFVVLVLDQKIKDKLFKKFLTIEFFFLILIFLILSLSNNISLGNIEILKIQLNNYLYALLSIVRSSGRLFWFVSYLLVFLSIYIIHLKYKKKVLFIFLPILFLQVFDISKSFEYFNKKKNLQKNIIENDSFWFNKELSNFEKILTTKPINYNKDFDKIAKLIEDKNFKKTNIIKLARVNRKKAAENRYKIIEELINKKLEKNTIYIIDNIGHLNYLKYLFKDSNVGFFFKDNMWIMIDNKFNLMNREDKLKLNEVKIKKIYFNNLISVKKETEKYLGFGWSHNFKKDGVWSEGFVSNLIFSPKQNFDILTFEANVLPYLNDKITKAKIEIFVNGNFKKTEHFEYYENDPLQTKKIKIKIKKEDLKNNIVNIEFKNKNPISPYEILKSPDSRKLNFLLLDYNFKT